MHLGLDEIEGAAAIQTEVYGDWFRDPWTWPEMAWVKFAGTSFPWAEVLQVHKATVSLRADPHFEPVVVPKALLGARPSVVMSPETRLIYQCSALAISKQLHKDIPPWVFGWRVRDDLRPSSKNDREWTRYLTHLSEMPIEHSMLGVDLASFFASVDSERAVNLCTELAGKSAATQLIGEVVLGHGNLASHGGLPQRSMASSIIANAYLGPLDGLLARGLRGGRVSGAVRWMDDIHVTGSESALYEINIELQQRCRQLGLELNSGKSKLGPARQMYIELADPAINRPPKLPNMASSAAGREGRIATHVSQLLEIEDQVLHDCSRHPRSAVKGLLRALRDFGQFQRYGEWLQAAHRLPHLADVLGRYFRDCGKKMGQQFWEEYSEWLDQMIRTPWLTLPWVRAQLFAGIPSYATSKSIQHHYEVWLNSGTDLQLLSLAIQRMARVDGDCLKDLARSRIDYVNSPLLLRAFALGLTNAGDGAAFVRSILERDRRNVLLIRALEATRWRSARVAPDFDPSDSLE